MIINGELRDPLRYSTSRRNILRGAAALAALMPIRQAFAADTLTVSDPGGAWSDAADKAFVKPFEQESGIKINHVEHGHYAGMEVKANIDTKAYTWDVVAISDIDAHELAPLGVLEPIDWSGEDMGQLMPTAKQMGFLGTDKYGKNGPQSWRDFWDVAKFPGRRAFHKHPIDMLEAALMADGVTPDKLYPLDLNHAFKKLDELKPHVNVWWTSGAQTAQLLQDGEVDMLPTWNARAQVVIDAGAPVEMVWNQGLYSMEGFAILKGDPKAALGQKFLKFASRAKQQAIFATALPYAPTNPKAYDFIAPERAKYLPTAPANLKQLVPSNIDWWAANKEMAIERFNTWLLA